MNAPNKEVKLDNFDISERKNIRSEVYYLIVNKNNMDGYFCFKSKVEEGWDLLTKNPIELNIKYEENNRDEKIYRQVISLHEVLI